MKTNYFVDIIKESLIGKELFCDGRNRGVITDVSLTKEENYISIETDHLSYRYYRFSFLEGISTISKEAVMQNSRQEKIERICNYINSGNFDYSTTSQYRYYQFPFSEGISTEAVMQNARQEKIERICNHIATGNFEFLPSSKERFMVDGKIKMSVMPAGRVNELDYGFYVKESNNYTYDFFTKDEVKKIHNSFIKYNKNKNKTIVENAFNNLDI